MKAKLDGHLIAEASTADVVCIEGNYYFPPTSLVNAVFAPNETPYTCPWKGRAQYWNIVTPLGVVTDGAWSYPEPKQSASAHVGRDFAGFVAFDRNRVELID